MDRLPSPYVPRVAPVLAVLPGRTMLPLLDERDGALREYSKAERDDDPLGLEG